MVQAETISWPQGRLATGFAPFRLLWVAGAKGCFPPLRRYRRALLLVGIGLAIGIPVALVNRRLMKTQLYGVSTYDPITLIGAVLLLAAAAALAGFIPARRAASVEPMNALRTE